MNNTKETSEEKRERLRHQELKNNPGGALNDGFNHANSGNIGAGMGWKGTGDFNHITDCWLWHISIIF